jgi:hypothetical protein
MTLSVSELATGRITSARRSEPRLLCLERVVPNTMVQLTRNSPRRAITSVPAASATTLSREPLVLL